MFTAQDKTPTLLCAVPRFAVKDMAQALEFYVRDPFGNLLLFAERLPEPELEAHSEHGTRR
jgi:hypothetical protein